MKNKVTPISGNYYWVHTVTWYRGSKDNPKVSRSEIPTIAFFEGETYNDGSKNTMPWQIVGSDEIFRTFESDDRCEHRKLYIIPIQKIDTPDL